jgi:hypothetical protein
MPATGGEVLLVKLKLFSLTFPEGKDVSSLSNQTAIAVRLPPDIGDTSVLKELFVTRTPSVLASNPTAWTQPPPFKLLTVLF